MNFWLREFLGWAMILLGVATFYLCVVLLLDGSIIEAGQLTVVGIVLFRGGVHLLKVAVAARVCTRVEKQLAAERTRPSPVPAWQPLSVMKRDR